LILCAGIVLVKRDEEKLFPGAEKRDRSKAEKDFGLKRDGSGKSVWEEGVRGTIFRFGDSYNR
jgi:hypothetical protein